jgi:exoribonuclease-2
MRDFDATYGAYAEFQRGMERYWCLRWLRQEDAQTVEATVRRENLVKLDRLPLLLRVPSIPQLNPGRRIRLAVQAMDFLTLELTCRYLETLEEGAAEEDAGAGDEESEGAVD